MKRRESGITVAIAIVLLLVAISAVSGNEISKCSDADCHYYQRQGLSGKEMSYISIDNTAYDYVNKSVTIRWSPHNIPISGDIYYLIETGSLDSDTWVSRVYGMNSSDIYHIGPYNIVMRVKAVKALPSYHAPYISPYVHPDQNQSTEIAVSEVVFVDFGEPIIVNPYMIKAIEVSNSVERDDRHIKYVFSGLPPGTVQASSILIWVYNDGKYVPLDTSSVIMIDNGGEYYADVHWPSPLPDPYNPGNLKIFIRN